ncbi:MAG: FAD-dependent oxidoreductase [Synergistaceae bacterium]|jgi:NADPH-dependent 2,4-dienoyl-CoA reductase/sulfur reductase-like enzyme|nr:FAD-dependent oxidoreductase [Synergistaceae bacterium]
MYDLIIVGGGPAGLAAAQAASEAGLRKIVIAERDTEPGGILNQCIHNGFGLHYFKEELTGPEYALRFIRMVKETRTEMKLGTMVLDVRPDRTVSMISRAEGYQVHKARSVVLAMGCRERTRGAIALPGSRPAGLCTGGTAQRDHILELAVVGRRVVIVGSGDIGLIMARRMTLEGAKVLACVELMPYSGGLARNIAQCLDDNGIPLYLSHTLTDIRGRDRVERVTAAKVDASGKPAAGTEFTLDCDTILLSVGLIPENELTRKAGISIDERTRGAHVFDNMETLTPGIFACGNVVHVHDLADYVTLEGQRAGKAAAAYANGEGKEKGKEEGKTIALNAGENVSYTVPQYIRPSPEGSVPVSFRVRRNIPKGAVEVKEGGELLAAFPRSHMSPGEMERVALPMPLIERVKTGTIDIAAKESSE